MIRAEDSRAASTRPARGEPSAPGERSLRPGGERSDRDTSNALKIQCAQRDSLSELFL